MPAGSALDPAPRFLLCSSFPFSFLQVAMEGAKGGCGCSTSGGASWLAWLLLLGVSRLLRELVPR
jgi:uncharacterized protein (TIGR03382 family)